LAFWTQKADAIGAAVEGPVSSTKPGSVIQLHPHVTVIVDEAAASKLENADYYRYAWAHKPWPGI
ncbi:MAG: glucosamine-6-phosphate deaminase, partial [Flavobacterium sp.]|nr:glucosamine-6-phosphate deaminase [Aeromicrobium sp.]